MCDAERAKNRPTQGGFLLRYTSVMTLEAAEQGGAITGFDVIGKVLGYMKDVAGGMLDISQLFQKTQLAEWISRTSFAKNLRVGVALLSMMPTQVSAQPPNMEALMKGAQTINSLILEANKSKREQLRDAIKIPKEQKQQKLSDVRGIIAELRKEFASKNDVDKAAFDLVLSNVLDPQTSILFQAMLSSDEEAPILQTWMSSMNIKSDFKPLYKSHIMTNPDLRNNLIDTIHELYSRPEIIAMQNHVIDSKLLYNYEVAFRAMNQPGYKEKNPERVKKRLVICLRKEILLKSFVF